MACPRLLRWGFYFYSGKQAGMENNPVNNSANKAEKSLYTRWQEELVRIKDTLPGCYYIALVSVDGLIVAGVLEGHFKLYATEEDFVSSLSLHMTTLGQRVGDRLDTGTCRLVTVVGKKGIQFSIPLLSYGMNEREYKWILTFGVRHPNSIDAVLANLRQCWTPLLTLLNLHNPPPFFES